MKKCDMCSKEKCFEDFYKHKSRKDGLQPSCIDCWKSYCGKPERKIKRNKTALKNGTNHSRYEYIRNWQFKKKYGITVSDYNQMLLEQNGSCAICDKGHMDCQNGLYVDHDHSTKKVRKLLCRDCNIGIGNFLEDPSLLLKAVEYLNKHKSVKLSIVKEA